MQRPVTHVEPLAAFDNDFLNYFFVADLSSNKHQKGNARIWASFNAAITNPVCKQNVFDSMFHIVHYLEQQQSFDAIARLYLWRASKQLDAKNAFEHLLGLVSKSTPLTQPTILTCLGICHEKGYGTEPDPKKAAECYQQILTSIDNTIRIPGASNIRVAQALQMNDPSMAEAFRSLITKLRQVLLAIKANIDQMQPPAPEKSILSSLLFFTTASSQPTKPDWLKQIQTQLHDINEKSTDDTLLNAYDQCLQMLPRAVHIAQHQIIHAHIQIALALPDELPQLANMQPPPSSTQPKCRSYGTFG